MKLYVKLHAQKPKEEIQNASCGEFEVDIIEINIIHGKESWKE